MAKSRGPYGRDNYWRALGKFIDEFASIETGMHLLLQQRTRTPLELARAVFSGVRVKDAMDLIRRVAQVRPLEPEIAADQEFIFAQLTLINNIRNDIIHYGASVWMAPGEWLVWNWVTALTDKKLRTFRVSPSLLLDLAHDLRKIHVHLVERHLWREPGLPSPFPKRDLALLDAAWRYKPPPQGHGHRKIRGTTPKRSRPPQPSRR